MQKLIYTHSKDRAQLTLPAVLTAAASNRKHVYTVNNHMNSVSKQACQVCCLLIQHLDRKARKDKLMQSECSLFGLFPFHIGRCVQQAAMASTTMAMDIRAVIAS